MHCNKVNAYVLKLITVMCLALSGCGGGGGSSTSNNGSTAGSGSGVIVAPPVAVAAANTQSVVVKGGPTNGVNLLYTSVTVCAPDDSSACRVIDNVLVDTGSTGFRVLASVLPESFLLPQQTTINGAALAECTQFADGNSWGPIKSANLILGGETLRNIPIQVIGDPAFPNVPSDCSSGGRVQNTVRDFGSNAILGIGNFLHDCGVACATQILSGAYYACGAVSCAPTLAPIQQQVRHPVSMMTTHNNGVMIELPAVPPEGAASATGTLVFGIGTAANNALGSARVHTLNPDSATLTASINSTLYANSFIDSGSNGVFFPSRTIPVCNSGFYCPSTTQSITSFVQGTNGNRSAANFSVRNADNLFRNNPSYVALPTLAGPSFGLDAVDFGLPFFFGKKVFTAIEESNTPAGAGPYVAF